MASIPAVHFVSERLAARREMRTRLLRPTLDHAAANVPAYTGLLGGVAAKIDTIEDLPLAPIVDKEMMVRNLEAFRDASLPTAAVQHTSGTSRRTLVLHRSPQEQAYIREFFNAVNQKNAPVVPVRPPLIVSAMGRFHGDPTPVPYAGRVFDLRVADPYWNLEQVVTAPWTLFDEMESPILLVGLESQLRIMTCRLIESGFDFRRSRVISIHSTGDLVTRRLARWYSTVWHAPITSRYSMTEVFGGADLCAECGDYHFDPFVIPEAVDPISREPVRDGYGVILVTGLYPFSQKQPIIRYWTGDLAKIRRDACSVDDFGFQLQGRMFRSIVVPGPSKRAEVLAAAAEVYDVIDEFPQVSSNEMFPDVIDVRDRTVLGHLRFQIGYDGSRLKIDVETRFTPYAYADAVRAMCDDIRERVIARHPDLQRRLEAGSMTFEVNAVGPKTLRAFTPDETE